MNQTSLTKYLPDSIEFKVFTERPGVGVLLMPDTPKYTLVAVSSDFLKTTGMNKEQVIGKGHFEVFPKSPDDPNFTGEQNLKESFAHIIKHKEPHQIPLQRYDIPNNDGTFSHRYWKISNAPVLGNTGEVLYIIHTADDVTEQVKAKKRDEEHKELQTAYEKIEESQQELKRFKFMADNAQDPFILMREDGSFAYLNLKALETFGYTVEEAASIRVPDVDPIYQDEAFAEVFSRAQKSEILQFETLHRRKDGLIYPVEVKMNGITLNGIPHMFAVVRDITERKKAEEELRKSEDRFRNMVNAVPQSIWITNAEGKSEFLNQHWCDYCGETSSDITADEIAIKYLHPEDAPKVIHVFREAMQSGEPFEVEQRNRSKEGEYRWFLNRGTPYKDPLTGQITKWFGVGVDIHDRKLAEEALKKSEEALEQKVQERTRELESQKNLLNNILVNSSNGISVTEMIWDKEGKIIDAVTILANAAAVNFTGLPKKVYLSKKATELDPNIFHSTYGQMCFNTLKTGEPSFTQYFFEATGRWLELTISKMNDRHLIHIFTDVTPIKEAQLQLERSVEELKRSNQNLEEFAYAASHDLKEPIRKIHFFSDRIKERLSSKLDEEERRYFERMDVAAKRMSSLIEDLLLYSHVSRGVFSGEAVDLNDTLSHVLDDLELNIEEKSATVSVDPMPTIKGHSRQLQQLFENLVANALKYSKPNQSPLLSITSRLINGNQTPLKLVGEEERKQYHLIEVCDNGIGFSSEDAERIFKVFTRLHGNAEYKGTGVGLSIARKVVENHGGYIWAESSLGEGATFSVLLPVK